MIADERRKQIVRLVKQRGSMSTRELSDLLGVSIMTVRRDLDYLNATSALRKHFGGASDTSQMGDPVTNFSIRLSDHADEKSKIATKAVELVNEGDSLFIDHGTTCTIFARELRRFTTITVVTFSLPVIAELSKTRVQLVSVGGQFNRPSESFVGPLAEEMISRFHADKFFLGTQGIDLGKGLTNADVFEANLKTLMVERADQVILLADSSKFSITGLYPNVRTDRIDVIVTTSLADRAALNEYAALGIKVILVD